MSLKLCSKCKKLYLDFGLIITKENLCLDCSISDAKLEVDIFLTHKKLGEN